MKRALVFALMSVGFVTAAMAQSPNMSASPGPHDPNPPKNTPDLRLPPPCAPAPNLAATGSVMSPAARATSATPGRVTPVDSGDVKCSTNTAAQSAAVPGLAPGIQ